MASSGNDVSATSTNSKNAAKYKEADLSPSDDMYRHPSTAGLFDLPLFYTPEDSNRHAEQSKQNPVSYSNESHNGSRQFGTGTTIKFPTSMNAYFQWKITLTFHLGPSKAENLHAVSIKHANSKCTDSSITLYDGPTKEHPILATIMRGSFGYSEQTLITISPSQDSNSQGGCQKNAEHVSPVLMTCTNSYSYTSNPVYVFSMDVGDGSSIGQRTEHFEWRMSQGEEVKELAKSSCGWKLVRMSGPVQGVGGVRQQRQKAFTSDGREIVAVVAYNYHRSWTKGMKFELLGTGRTGELGAAWETVTVVSAMGIIV